jgi:protein TonB
LEELMSRKAGWIAAALVAGMLAGPPSVHTQGWPPPPEELPKFGDYVYVGELPEAIKKVAPVYPEAARARRIDGTVIVNVLVGKDGLVKDARVVPQRSIPALDQAALDCAKQWVFKPALSRGEPVAVWVAIPVKFVLDSKPPGPVPPPAPKEPDARRVFVQEVAALRALGVRHPSAADSARRGRIIREALALDPQPRIPDQARLHFARGLRAGACGDSRDSTLRAMDEFLMALHEAPWWGAAYLELGRALQHLNRGIEAAIPFELYLLAEPEAADRDTVEKQIARLRRGAGPAR